MPFDEQPAEGGAPEEAPADAEAGGGRGRRNREAAIADGGWPAGRPIAGGSRQQQTTS